MKPQQYNRREFLQTLAGSLALGSTLMSFQEDTTTGIPVRPIGNTGIKIPIIGLGGWDFAANKTDNEAIRLARMAVDEGMTFMDNSWDYHGGHAEELMGEALSAGGRRDKVFLMTKVCGRSYEHAKTHLEDSLKRLKTDHLDLWQFHGIKYKDDPDLIFDEENGAIKAALEAKKEGKIRFIGFTGHQDPDFHLAMLNKDFDWDTVQMPVNILDSHYRSFQKEVLPLCTRKNIGIIGMKSLAAQNAIIAREFNISPQVCRRFTLSMPVSTLVCGIQTEKELKSDLEMARNFKPLTEDKIAELLDMSYEKGMDGDMEAYKTGNYGCDWHHDRM